MLSAFRFNSDPNATDSAKPLLVAFSGGGYTFVDEEIPTGTIDGVNAAFTLTQSPNPAKSLQLFKNGIAMTPGVDYNLAANTITYVAGAIPQAGDAHVCWYRY